MRGKVSQWYRQLHSLRTDEENPRDLSFRDFLAEVGQEAKDSQPLTPERLFSELGLNWQTMKFSALLNHDDGFYLAAELVREAIDRGMRGQTIRQQVRRDEMLKAVFSQAAITTDSSARYLTPEFFTPVLMRGVVQGQYWDQLISQDLTVPQPKVTMPLMSRLGLDTT